MTTLYLVRRRHVKLMRQTLETLGHIVHTTTPNDARTFRDPDDGDKGWTSLEILCHLRDFDQFFYDRAVMILEQDHPDLPAYDHEQIAIDRQYNQQDWHTAYAELVESRHRFREWFKALSDEQWERVGNHPERDHPFTLTDAAMQIGLHDVTHIEQITRILRQRRS